MGGFCKIFALVRNSMQRLGQFWMQINRQLSKRIYTLWKICGIQRTNK